MGKIWKRFKAWVNRPMPEYTCDDCGETYAHFGPDGPHHKCNMKDVANKAIRDYVKEHELT